MEMLPSGIKIHRLMAVYLVIHVTITCHVANYCNVCAAWHSETHVRPFFGSHQAGGVATCPFACLQIGRVSQLVDYLISDGKGV
jgi:hypothetical protein